jgi:ribosomal protein S18 acetylase RimI-like enzyme
MNPIIEEAQTQDHPLITEFMEESIDYHHRLDPRYYREPEESETGLFLFLNKIFYDKKHTVFVARYRGERQILGFVVLGVFEASGFDFDTKIQKYGSIIDLYVSPLARGIGLGESLMKRAETHYLSLGIDHVGLQMSCFNGPAFKLYQRLGYVPRQQLLFKELTPVVTLEKEIEQGQMLDSIS